MSEFTLIEDITKGFKIYHENVEQGIGDDCAVWKEGSELKLYTTDTMVEGDHFLKAWLTPEQIGVRFIESNVSDIASMGGLPEFLFVSLVLDNNTDPEWTKRLYFGIKKVCRKYKMSLLGGNTTHGRTLSITAGIIGKAGNKAVYRNGAKAGDLLAVSGDVGSACMARLLLNKGIKPPTYLLKRFSDPEARVKEAQLIKKYATAMIDISDGVASEARHLAEESGLGVIVDTGKMPVLSKAKKYEKMAERTIIEAALRGGEDYELMFTISPNNWDRLVDTYKFSAKITVIGIMTTKKDYLQSEKGKTSTLVKGFDHFSDNINLF